MMLKNLVYCREAVKFDLGPQGLLVSIVRMILMLAYPLLIFFLTIFYKLQKSGDEKLLLIVFLIIVSGHATICFTRKVLKNNMILYLRKKGYIIFQYGKIIKKGKVTQDDFEVVRVRGEGLDSYTLVFLPILQTGKGNDHTIYSRTKEGDCLSLFLVDLGELFYFLDYSYKKENWKYRKV